MLNDQINRDASVMDEKLADYVFFPLSHIFRNHGQYPRRLIELAIKCLTIITIHGWKSNISPEIMQQLLILLTFILGGVPGREEASEIPEETELESLRALTALITVTGSSVKAAAALVEEKMVPSLGHTITVLLSCVTDGRAPDIQLEALRTLGCFYTGIRDHAALASFLPGVVSSLTRLLAKPQSEKTRVLATSIQTLKLVLVQVLGDVKTTSIAAKKAPETLPENDNDQVLSPAWLKATASQVKLAMATILKLRTHDSQDIHEALLSFSLAMLDECHTSLENCASILVETAMVLSQANTSHSLSTTSLQDLAIIYPELGETIKVTCYNWMTSLPRIMQSADEGNKQMAIGNLIKGMSMVRNLQLDSSLLDESMAAALRDSVTFLVANRKPDQIVDQVTADTSWYNQDVIKAEETSKQYQHVLVNLEGQSRTRSAILGLLSQVGSAPQQTKLAAEMLEYARDATGDTRTAAFWLSFELLKAALSRSSEFDDFLDFTSLSTPGDDTDAIFQELYLFSVMILDSHSELSEADWRLEATALEATSFAASRSGEAFRLELADVLYPITTFLGSQNPRLREHAITTLNLLAVSCGYSSVSQLVIENVDYMTTSVTLRLNTFDISPASTKVLTMMTHLTGPGLLPHLDDVVASIFAALDNYHGYPTFVESLFSVLKEIVNQGAKSDKLLLEGRQNGPGNHKKVPPVPVTVEDIVDLLKKRQARENRTIYEEATFKATGSYPQQPWGEGNGEDGPGGETEGDSHADKEKPPKTPTYALLEKITSLTQHYLTSPSPTLRKSLLDLLATVSPALSGDEDAFLPLINAIWPVVISRLYDHEAFVVISACDALSMLCVTAGDFLSSRIKTEWWDTLGKWCRTRKAEAVRSQGKKTHPETNSSRKASTPASQSILIPIRSGYELSAQQTTDVASGPARGGLGRFAQAVQIWEAVVRLLVAIVSHVRIEPEIFDEFLELLADILDKNPAARKALEVINEDAVWLVLYQQGHIAPPKTPQLEGYVFTPLPGTG